MKIHLKKKCFLLILSFSIAISCLSLACCRSGESTEQTPGFEAELFLRSEPDNKYLYCAISDADKLPVLSLEREYLLDVRIYPQESPFYSIVPCSDINLVYDSEKLEITAIHKDDHKFIVRGLAECSNEVIEVHHASFADTEFLPCSITVNFN